jgi:general secretion pathway protein D
MARIDVVRGSSVARLVLVLAALLVGPALPERAFAQDDQGDDNSTNNPNPQPLPVAPGLRPPGLRDRLPTRPLPSSTDDEGTETSTSTSGAPPAPPTATSGGGSAAGSAGGSTSSGELGAPSDRAKPPEVQGAQRITLDMLSTNVYDLVKYYADITGRNAIIGDKKELQGAEVSIISNRPVGVYEAEKAIIAALEVAGYAIVVDGATVTVVKTGAAAQAAIPVRQGGDLPGSGFVTQIIPLENVSVGDVTTVISGLVSPDAKVLAYNPSNTLIITEQASNLRRVYSVIKQLDIAAPKSRLEVIPLIYANAEEVKAIIEQIYGTAAESTAPASATKKTTSTSTSASARRTPKREDTAVSSEAVSAGVESRYIDKVISDERTNALIVLADDQGHAAVRDIVGKLDVDVDPASRSQIHVVKLEHAKAEDVATVLANLSEGGSSSSKTSSSNRGAATTASARRPTAQAEAPSTTTDGNTGVLAAFDSGMRITHDETTNSLVIIAANDDFEIVKRVIDELDAKRRQVYVDCVVLELSSEDTFDLGLAYHGPLLPNSDNLTIAGGQFGQSSLGLSQDLLSGLALGVYGETVDVPFGDGTVIPVPAFGIVLNALKTNQSVTIVSNPNLMTLDNEEAEIVVGRKIPFPTSSGLNSLGQPVISYQREDVAITMKLTPRINSENYVTMVIELEVSEVEEDDSALDPATAGFITSKREVKTTALVGDNQTVVLGGLVGTTETQVETKVPILGDLPLIGSLFRGSRDTSRKTNLMVFLTPHIVDDEMDLTEIMKVKEAQRQEFLRRFYGKSRDEQMEAIKNLLRYSMNVVDEPSYYRGSPEVLSDEITVGGAPISEATRTAIAEELGDPPAEVGEGAGALPVDDLLLDPGDEPSPGGE